MKDLEQSIAASLSALPEELLLNVENVWKMLFTGALDTVAPLSQQQVNEFSHVLACSEFVQKQACLHVDTVLQGFNLSEAEKMQLPDNYQLELWQAMESAKDEAAILSLLRRSRNQRMLLIAWADSLGADVEQVILSLSELADCYIQVSCDWAYQKLCARYGIPRDEEGVEQKLIVIGMGKLGAYELNFSSDIDLIYCYPSAGETDGDRRITNEEFFLRMCRLLSSLLDQKTPDGFVFRVDTRLRPFGNSGALAQNFTALEAYYQSSAREWERYAMIKGRLITGEEVDKKYLMSMIKPFVYRRYLDYGVFDSIRVMKRQIDEQLRKKDNEDSVKLGPGGIREIEFIGQAFQLVRGGRDVSLQQRSIIPLLGLLAEKNIIEKKTHQDLVSDYCYLRRLENAIQQIADQQTHLLPKDEISQAHLLQAMHMGSWPSLVEKTQGVMQRVHGYFNELVASTAPDEVSELGQIDWINADMPTLVEYFQDKGFLEPDQLAKIVHDFCTSYNVRQAQSKGREYLALLLNLFFKQISQQSRQIDISSSFLQLLERISTRTVYLVLLVENEQVLKQLIKLAIGSPWVVSQIAKTPLLLDELIDPRRLYAPATYDEMVEELDEIIGRIEETDEEQILDALRVFKQVNMLRVAAADLTGAIPLMIVSDKLTAIAEVIVNKAVLLSWQTITKKYGIPKGAGQDKVSGFAVIGFGKVGGFELGFGSDLDLVFLHRDFSDDEHTCGDKSVPLSVFYSRLVRRIISLLTTRTQSGPLYEIDLRLRPNGNSGLLVSSLAAFKKYQIEKAWTWEQQALIRARLLNVQVDIAASFSVIREQSLCAKREPEAIKKDIIEMRTKMRENLLKAKAGHFDLKQGYGGIVDIEFIVQFGVLTHAAENKALIQYTDNIQLIKNLEVIGFLTSVQSQTLVEAYQRYREASHHATLAERKAVVVSGLFEEQAKAVCSIWNEFFN